MDDFDGYIVDDIFKDDGKKKKKNRRVFGESESKNKATRPPEAKTKRPPNTAPPETNNDGMTIQKLMKAGRDLNSPRSNVSSSMLVDSGK